MQNPLNQNRQKRNELPKLLVCNSYYQQNVSSIIKQKAIAV
jgi:hypothetical protein